jgi:hypothetical protein
VIAWASLPGIRRDASGKREHEREVGHLENRPGRLRAAFFCAVGDFGGEAINRCPIAVRKLRRRTEARNVLGL